jgi:opacity protein-like surface antigen
MTRTVLVAGPLLVAALLCAAAASGQGSPLQSPHRISVGLGGGVSVPVSDAKDAFKTGFNGQGFVKLNLGGLPVAPRLDFTFQSFDLKGAKVASAGTGTAPTGTGSVLAGVANVQIPLMHGRIEPYLVAGVGAYNVKTKTDDTSSYAGSTESKTEFGVNGGAGAAVRIGPLSVYAEGRVDNVFSDKGVIDTKSIQVVPVTFGVVY